MAASAAASQGSPSTAPKAVREGLPALTDPARLPGQPGPVSGTPAPQPASQPDAEAMSTKISSGTKRRPKGAALDEQHHGSEEACVWRTCSSASVLQTMGARQK